MATEPDLSALLPSAPPPRPHAREAAVGAALSRFDGETVPARAARRWRLAARPQLGALAAAALVAAIGLPLWLSGEQQPIPPRTANVAPARPTVSAATTDVAAESKREDGFASSPKMAAVPAPRAGSVPSVEQATNASLAERARPVTPVPALAAAPLPPPPALAPVSAPPPPPPPPPPTAMAEAAADNARDIVVTGSRVMGRAAKSEQRRERQLAGPGRWNACTIDDPRQDMTVCRKAAPVGEGLMRAWQGDLPGAVADFDRAIEASPKSASAWLNRGLAYARMGDDRHAIADFDKAVGYAPNDPRGWFYRSQALRRQGKTVRADADAARAIQLDPRYEELID